VGFGANSIPYAFEWYVLCVMPEQKRYPARGAVSALRKHGINADRVRRKRPKHGDLNYWSTGDKGLPSRQRSAAAGSFCRRNEQPDLADDFLRTFMEDVQQTAPRRIVERCVAANG
jgi:hypothetical protein